MISGSSEKPTPIVRRTINFLLGIWGNEIRKAAAEKNTLIVIVKPKITGADTVFSHKMVPVKNWADSKVQKMIEFAKKSAGERVFVEHGAVHTRRLKEEILRRGFQIDRKALNGKSFGEYWNRCVEMETRGLANALKVNKTHIRQIPELSLWGFPSILRNFSKSGTVKKIPRRLRPRRI